MARTKGRGGITNLDGTAKNRCRHWRLRVYVDGRESARRFTGTYKQAEEALEAFKRELSRPRRGLTFGEYSEEWQARRRANGSVGTQTLSKDETTIRRLNRAFEDMKLADIGRRDVESGLASIAKGNNGSGKQLNGTTMNKTFVLMKQIMSDAVLDGLVDANPLDTLRAPKRAASTREALGFDEVRDFLAQLEMRPLDAHTMAVRLAVLAGLRRGEVCGLEWRDVRGGMIHVTRSVVERTGETKGTKSAAGLRAVPILPQLQASLDAWKVQQSAAFASLGIPWGGETPVVASAYGTRMAAQNLWRWWNRNRESLGVDCTLHELRHTFLTMLANSGASLQSLKSVAGWSSIDMADVYVHDDDQANRAAVGLLEERFRTGRGGGTAYGTD